jgi:hypothetical protein
MEMAEKSRIKGKLSKRTSRSKSVDVLITAVHYLNVFSKSKLGCSIFKADSYNLNHLRNNVRNEADFDSILSSISTFIDEVNTDEIVNAGKIAPAPSLNLIENLFQLKKVNYSKDAIDVLRICTICDLPNRPFIMQITRHSAYQRN